MFNLENELKKVDDENEYEDKNDDYDPHFEPKVTLEKVETKSFEEDEDSLLSIRCKLYRFDTSETPGVYKDRGVGNLNILKHKNTKKIRIVMRREQTLKLCANHYLNSKMKLVANMSSDRCWVWAAPSDFSDDVPKNETLACRFSTLEDAQEFKKVFEQCVKDLDDFEKEFQDACSSEDILKDNFEKIKIDDKKDESKHNSIVQEETEESNSDSNSEKTQSENIDSKSKA